MLRGLPNVYVDLSGSGVDGGMLEACLEAVGVERLLWGCDLTIETGWAKLRYLEHLLPAADLELRPLAQRRGASSLRRVSRRLMRIDVNAFVGAYPFRRVPGTAPEALLAAMDRTGIDDAWVTHLPGVFWRDPTEGNAWLLELAPRGTRASGRCRRCIRGSPSWRDALRAAADAGAPAVRADPTFYGIDPAGPAMRALAAACGEADVPLALAVRFEDGRQRHPNDHAPELPAAAVRALVRSDPRVRLLITHADRPFIEEVHFGSTPERGVAHLVGHLLDLGAAGGSSPDAARHDRRRPLRARHRPAAAASGERGRQARPARPRAGDRAAIESGNARASDSRAELSSR